MTHCLQTSTRAATSVRTCSPTTTGGAFPPSSIGSLRSGAWLSGSRPRTAVRCSSTVGYVAAAIALTLIGAYSFIVGWNLDVDERDALVIATRQVGFPVGSRVGADGLAGVAEPTHVAHPPLLGRRTRPSSGASCSSTASTARWSSGSSRRTPRTGASSAEPGAGAHLPDLVRIRCRADELYRSAGQRARPGAFTSPNPRCRRRRSAPPRSRRSIRRRRGPGAVQPSVGP